MRHWHLECDSFSGCYWQQCRIWMLCSHPLSPILLQGGRLLEISRYVFFVCRLNHWHTHNSHYFILQISKFSYLLFWRAAEQYWEEVLSFLDRLACLVRSASHSIRAFSWLIWRSLEHGHGHLVFRQGISIRPTLSGREMAATLPTIICELVEMALIFGFCTCVRSS